MDDPIPEAARVVQISALEDGQPTRQMTVRPPGARPATRPCSDRLEAQEFLRHLHLPPALLDDPAQVAWENAPGEWPYRR